MNRENLHSKIWYRAVKVLFLVVFVVVQLIGFTLAYSGSQYIGKRDLNVKNFILDARKENISDNGIHDYLSEKNFVNNSDIVLHIDSFRPFIKDGTFDWNKGIPLVLPEEKRKELDGIVLSMIKQHASDEEIQAIVNDFKAKYMVANSAPIENNLTSQQLDNLLSNSRLGFDDIVKLSKIETKNTEQPSLFVSILKKASYFVGFFIAISFIFWLITKMFFYILLGERIYRQKV